jgi:GT2 family glycosyltransferase
LYSVEKAVAELEAEVWVVDNASSDGSVEYLRRIFPFVHFIANLKNAGFAKANNQALEACKGEYVLFLNPDTLLPEDCLTECLSFINQKVEAGALGIRMVDGRGKFLPESKRSFPNPVTSFYKLIGLSSLFPKSKTFARYALGYLNEFQNHEVDVLAGAFILAKKDVLIKLGGFDEAFFMYGEDIDLSYRILKAGYKNYYFSGSSIIHFKGESTRKGSLNYVKMFYQAMHIFVQKHYGGSKASVFRLFIQIAILSRAMLAAFLKFVLKIGLPLLDTMFIFASFELVTFLWIEYIRQGYGFLTHLVNIALPGFTLVFLVAASLAGIYDNKYKPAKAFYSALTATIVMLAVYSLLPERFRFSRGIILFGGLTALVLITVFRWLLLKWRVVDDTNEVKKQQQTIIVATPEEFKEIKELMQRSGLKERIMGRVAPNGIKEDSLGTIEHLKTLLESIKIREIIFCKGYLSYSTIINRIQELPQNVYLRFHAFGSQSIVGSDSKDTSGESMSADGNFQLTYAYHKRMKRLLDIGISISILATFPIHLFVIGLKSVQNASLVLIGKKTWISYSHPKNWLPSLKPGVLTTTGFPVKFPHPANRETANLIDHWYAKNYDWKQDLRIIIKNYHRLGGRA